MAKNNPRGFFNAVKKAKSIVVIPSARPDADSHASGIAIRRWLELKGKSVDLYIGEKPFKMAKLFEENFIVVDTNTIDFGKYDLLIVLDCGNPPEKLLNDWRRFGVFRIPTNLEIAAIDHHKETAHLTDNFIYEIASSTSELIYRYIYQTEGIKPDKELATYLFQGIASDTGYLRWNISAETFKVIYQLLEQGADLKQVLNATFTGNSMWAFQALPYVISKVQFDQNMGLTYSEFTQKDLENMKLTREQWWVTRIWYQAILARSTIGYPLDLIFEDLEGQEGIHVSGRSDIYQEKPFDITELMAKCGGKGGGHMGAAAFELPGSLSEVKRKVFAAVKEIREN